MTTMAKLSEEYMGYMQFLVKNCEEGEIAYKRFLLLRELKEKVKDNQQYIRAWRFINIFFDVIME